MDIAAQWLELSATLGRESGAEALWGLFERLDRIATDGPLPADLESARAEVLSNVEQAFQSNESLARVLALDAANGLSVEQTLSHRDGVRAVTVEDVRDAATALQRSRRVLRLSGDVREDTAEMLRRAGFEVEYHDVTPRPQ